MLHKKWLFLLIALTPLFIAADSPSKTHVVAVQIDSRPDMAEVWVDGKFVGSTPLPYHLTPGDHTVAVVHPRFATWTRTLTVMPEQFTRVGALLQEATEKPCP